MRDVGSCEPPLLANLQALDADALTAGCTCWTILRRWFPYLTPSTGDYLGEYGEFGEGPGYLRVPYGPVIFTATGQPMVTAGDGARVVVYSTSIGVVSPV